MLTDQELTADNFCNLDPLTTRVYLRHCYSEQWDNIVNELTHLPHLHTVSLKHCNSGDIGCWLPVQCESLKRVELENCDVTDDGIAILLRSPNLGCLEELNLDDNDGISAEGFKNAMTHLSPFMILQMRLPMIE